MKIYKESVGKFVLIILAVTTAILPFIADWNESHIYNAHWTPHAKFHNAQTMSFALITGITSVLLTLFPGKKDSSRSYLLATVLGLLYWWSLIPCIFFPGTAFYDTDILGGYGKMPVVFGLELNQVYGAFFFSIVGFVGLRLTKI